MAIGEVSKSKVRDDRSVVWGGSTRRVTCGLRVDAGHVQRDGGGVGERAGQGVRDEYMVNQPFAALIDAGVVVQRHTIV
jgi:hypothetical protein